LLQKYPTTIPYKKFIASTGIPIDEAENEHTFMVTSFYTVEHRFFRARSFTLVLINSDLLKHYIYFIDLIGIYA